MKELGFDKDIKSETVEENNNTVEKSSKKDKSNKKEKLNRDEKSSNNEKLSNKEKLSKKEKPNKNEKLSKKEKLKASKLKEEIKLEVKKVLKKEIIDFDVEEITSKVSLLDYNKNLLQECVPWHNKVNLFCLSFSRNNISPYHMFFS